MSANPRKLSDEQETELIQKLQKKVKELITKPLIKSFLDFYKEITVKRAS